MTGATAPRLQLELIAARILLPGAAGEAGYAARLDRLERRLDVGGVPTAAVSYAAPAPPAAARAAAAPPPRPPRPPAAPRPGRLRSGAGRPAVAPVFSAAPDAATPGPPSTEHEPPPDDDVPPEHDAPSEPAAPAPTASAPPRAPEPAPVTASVPDPAPVAHPKGPGGLDTDALRRSWPDVLEWLSRNKRVTWTFVAQNAQVVDYDGQRVLLGISTVGLAETFRRGAHADYVRQALIDVLGVDARVEGVAVRRGRGCRPGTAPSEPSGSGRRLRGCRAGRRRRPRRPPPHPPGRATASGSAPAGAPGPPGERRRRCRRRSSRTREPASWSDAPPPPDTAPTWASPLEQAKAAVAVETEAVAVEHQVDDTAISADDESIDDLTDVGVPVVERILGGTVIAEDPK